MQFIKYRIEKTSRKRVQRSAELTDSNGFSGMLMSIALNEIRTLFEVCGWL
jgi:hypothetical protein